jgi:hypothetical protein
MTGCFQQEIDVEICSELDGIFLLLTHRPTVRNAMKRMVAPGQQCFETRWSVGRVTWNIGGRTLLKHPRQYHFIDWIRSPNSPWQKGWALRMSGTTFRRFLKGIRRVMVEEEGEEDQPQGEQHHCQLQVEIPGLDAARDVNVLVPTNDCTTPREEVEGYVSLNLVGSSTEAEMIRQIRNWNRPLFKATMTLTPCRALFVIHVDGKSAMSLCNTTLTPPVFWKLGVFLPLDDNASYKLASIAAVVRMTYD